MNRLGDPLEIRALESKGEFRRSTICSVSVTIGIDRATFNAYGEQRIVGLTAEKTVSPAVGHERQRPDG